MLKEILLTTDLQMLVATATLALFSFMPYFLAYIKYWGIGGHCRKSGKITGTPAMGPTGAGGSREFDRKSGAFLRIGYRCPSGNCQ